MRNKILIVGQGSIGKRYLRLIEQFDENFDIGVISKYKVGLIGQPLIKHFLSIEDALSFRPNIAIIASPATCHMQHTQLLASTGMGLLIEKPIAKSTSDFESLDRLISEKDLKIAIGYNLRFSKSLIHFKSVIDSGALGKILSVRIECGGYMPLWRPDRDYRTTVSSKKSLGGGVLRELSHEIDYLNWIFGDIKWVKAALRRQSEFDIDVEDIALMVMGVQNGRQSQEIIVNMSMDFARWDPIRSCTAIGERGSLRWNGLIGVVDSYMENQADWHVEFRQQSHIDDTYIAQLKEFFLYIESGVLSSLANVADGFLVLKVIEAAESSNICNGAIKKIYT